MNHVLKSNRYCSTMWDFAAFNTVVSTQHVAPKAAHQPTSLPKLSERCLPPSTPSSPSLHTTFPAAPLDAHCPLPLTHGRPGAAAARPARCARARVTDAARHARVGRADSPVSHHRYAPDGPLSVVRRPRRKADSQPSIHFRTATSARRSLRPTDLVSSAQWTPAADAASGGWI